MIIMFKLAQTLNKSNTYGRRSTRSRHSKNPKKMLTFVISMNINLANLKDAFTI